jgi:FlaA1/EpsC-like NDP-sugar epimerase
VIRRPREDGPSGGFHRLRSAAPFRALVPHRFTVQALLDAVVWVLALWLATYLRYEFDLGASSTNGVLAAIPLVVAVQLAAGVATGMYTGRWHLGSFEEVAALVRSVGLTGLVLLVVDAPVRWVPLSVAIIAPAAAFLMMAGIRYAWRLVVERSKRPFGHELSRVVVFGAGEGGVQAISAMLRDPESAYLPVAILDDDPRKRQLRLRGVPMAGTRSDLARVAREMNADILLIAVPSADAHLVRELSELGVAAQLHVRVLPPAKEMFHSQVQVDDIRPLTEADLLGRREIDTDVVAIADYLAGKRVLVTGAGGSIGSELCRQLRRFNPAELIMLDRDESALHEVQLSIEGRAMLDSANLVVCDIRDRPTLDRLFGARRPEVVFHAAALKHLPLLERHPGEALQTNVWGTLNLLEAAEANGVERFVNISTDKAADPTSVLGYSKRVTERLTAYTAAQASGDYLSVRFGNVLGSRGSVLTTFRAQIAAGGPVTVTHPDVTRYFMTVEEAVQLVVQAGAIGRSGEVLVLDMGHPVRIADVARQLVDQAERRVDIVYTGLRTGEKLHEALLGRGEVDSRPAHQLISQLPVEPMDPSLVRGLSPLASGEDLRSTLEQLTVGIGDRPSVRD